MTSSRVEPSKLLPKVLFGFVFLSVIFAGFLYYDEWNSRNKIDRLQVENQQKEAQAQTIETEDQVGDLYAAKQILDKATANRVLWSKVATNILAQEKVTADIKFSQVKVTPDGSVLLSGEAESLKSVAILLQKLREQEIFAGPFVPQVNGDNGIYRFTLQFQYLAL